MELNKKIARKLERAGFDYENENYHEVAGMFFDLSKAVAEGKFNNFYNMNERGTFDYMDGEKIIKFLLEHSWV